MSTPGHSQRRMNALYLTALLSALTVGFITGDHECGHFYGTCMLDVYPCDGDWVGDLCLGPPNRKCCVHPKYLKDVPLDPECVLQEGVCQEDTETCNGRYVANLCKGPPSRKCCTEDPNDPFHPRTPPKQIGLGLELVTAKNLDERWKDSCGINGANVAKDIQSNPHSWPWQAVLKPTNVEGMCGAVLIAPNWLLTAAHCFKKFTGAKQWVVRLGKHNLLKTEPHEKEYEIEELFLHSQHGMGQDNYHNLALIKLKKKSVLDVTNINAVCMPTMDMTFTNEECYVLGWGKQGTGKESLRQVRTNVMSHKMCMKRVWGLSRGQICTNEGSDIACIVDAGGPLVCKKEGRFFIAGIVTPSENKCGSKAEYKPPAVFTRLPFYLDWIYMITRNNEY